MRELNHITLPPKLQDKVSAMPETGMGYHTVTLTMEDDTKIFLVHVINGTFFRSTVWVDGNKIKDVKLCATL